MLVDFAPRVGDLETGDPSDSPVYSIETCAGIETPTGPGNPQFALSRDGERITINYDPDRVVDRLVREVGQMALLTAPPELLLVHAGVVGTPAGDGVLLTGESGSGKTTTVAALVQEGYSYLSDEAAVIDPDTALVRPWPRPLDFKPGAIEIDRFRALLEASAGLTCHVPADRVRKGAIGPPAPVRVVIDYRYEPATRTVVDSLSPAQGVAVLGSAAPALRHQRDAGLQLLAAIVSGASAYRLRTGSLDDAVRWVRTLAEG